MTEPVQKPPAALHCPTCGARGILPLAQPHTPDGGIADPVTICPVCDVEFRAVGAKWLGAFALPAPTLTEEEREAVWRHIAQELGRRARSEWTD